MGNKRVLLFILIPLLFCFHDEKEQIGFKLLGENWWFKYSKKEVSYFINTYKYDFKKNVEWPPLELCNRIDICFDVTGSTYQKKIYFNDKIITLAEYNLEKLENILNSLFSFNYGDVITLRLFGEDLKGDSISLRDEKTIKLPNLNILMEGQVATRYHNDLTIRVLGIVKPKEDLRKVINEIASWYSPKITKYSNKNNMVMKSPLLQYMKNIILNEVNINCNKHIFIFVTDGWVEIEEINFYPSIYEKSNEIIEKVKSKINSLSLKPFEEAIENIEIIIIGLNDDGIIKYREAQIRLFNYFFSPQKISMIYY